MFEKGEYCCSANGVEEKQTILWKRKQDSKERTGEARGQLKYATPQQARSFLAWIGA